MNLPSQIFQTFNINIGKYSIPFSILQAVAIVFLLFLLILSLAQFRRHFIDWSFKGAVFGIFFGFLLALILEGFLLIGGRTAITGVLGWKNAPKPISVALDAGRTKLVQVLGVTEPIPSSNAQEVPSVENAVSVIQSLNPTDIKKVKTLICTP
ncbi:MAG TPA: hypothetical protein VFI61_00435 [Patescibacteria group bacterium]|nr:hypothetical protein [Patescibacteria group bacterium]